MTINKDGEHCGAPCGFCWEMLFAYSPTCAYHDETIDEHIDTALALLRGKEEK